MRAVVASLWMLAAAGAHGQPASMPPFALPASELAARALALPKRDEFSAAFLIDESRYELDAQHRWTWSRYQVYRVDTDDAVFALGQVQAPWEPHRQQRPEIRARVISSDGREYHLDPATLADESARDPDPRIFDDVRQLRGPLPAIAVGSVVELQLRVADLEPPLAAGRAETVWLAVDGAVERTRIVVSAPAALPLRHATRLLPEARVSEENLDGRRILTLEQGPLALDAGEFDFTSLGDQPAWPQFSFSTGDSWDEVAVAYAGVAEPYVRTKEAQPLLPARLPEGREARIARLLEILHKRVRYTGVLFGVGKLVPNPPSVTLERRYGDCKDKAVVLASMLRAAGLPAELALLNAGSGTDIDPELPGIGGFNHMIVHVPGDSPLWIDPTVEHMGVGELPLENRGRWALVIGGSGPALLRTPDPRPGDQYRVEMRELRLADYGPGDLKVVVRVNGSDAERHRRAWSESAATTVRLRDELLKAVHGAKTITGFERTEDASSGQLVYRFEARGVESGRTRIDEAVVTESFVPLFNRIPYVLRMDKEAGTRVDAHRAERGRPTRVRTADWVFEPFITEWQLRVVPPTGLRPRALPGDQDFIFGPALFSLRFETDGAGHVIATVRVDSGSGRYTVEQGEAFRSAFLEHQAQLRIELRFEHEAAALIRAGDEAGAMRRHRELIAQEPRAAIHLVRAAQALLDFGLVPEARDLALRATRLEPRNALAFSRLGHVLDHNEAGVRFGRGFDRDGAVKAHREAVRLDPEELWYNVNVAAAAEYGKEGTRFGPGWDPELAITGYRTYLEQNPQWTDGTGLIINCLWQLGRYGEIAGEAAGLPDNSWAQPIKLAARVMTDGAAVALRENAVRGDLATRRRLIADAVAQLGMARRYEQVREVHAEMTAAGDLIVGNNPLLMQMMLKTRRVEELADPPVTAAGTVESLMRTAILHQAASESLVPFLSSRARRNGDLKWFTDLLRETLGPLHETLVRRLFDRGEVARDVVLSNLEFRESRAPGDLSRVAVMLGGDTALTFFLVPESSGWRVLTLAPFWHPIGREVLTRLDAGDTVSARALLEMAREDTERNEAVSQSDWLKQFARALPRHEESATEEALRMGALFLMAGPLSVAATVEDVRIGQSLEAISDQRSAWQWLLYTAAQEAGEYGLMIEAAGKIYPGKGDEAEASLYLANAQFRAGEWQDAEATSRAWLQAHPSDRRALRWLVASLNAAGRSREGLELLASEVQRGRASPEALNNYAWQALIAESVDDDAVRAAEFSYNRQSQQSLPAGHTLACLYAVSGRVTEARDLAKKLIEQHLELDPDDGQMWLIRGLIFEHLREPVATIRAYHKIERPKRYDPGSVHAIANARLAKLEIR